MAVSDRVLDVLVPEVPAFYQCVSCGEYYEEYLGSCSECEGDVEIQVVPMLHWEFV